MAFTRANVPGWASFEVLTSAQMNALDIDHANAIDGADGGVYNPASQIEIGGAGLEVSGQFIAGSTSLFNGAANFVGPANFFDGVEFLDHVDFSSTVRCFDDVQLDEDLTVDGLTTLANATATLFAAFAATIGALTTTGAVNLSGTNTISGVTSLTAEMALSGGGRIRKRVTNASDINSTYSFSTSDIVVVRSPQVTASRDYTLDSVGAANGAEVEFLNYTGFVINILKDGASQIGKLPVVTVSGYGFDGRPGRAVCKYIDDGISARWMVTEGVTSA